MREKMSSLNSRLVAARVLSNAVSLPIEKAGFDPNRLQKPVSLVCFERNNRRFIQSLLEIPKCLLWNFIGTV